MKSNLTTYLFVVITGIFLCVNQDSYSQSSQRNSTKSGTSQREATRQAAMKDWNRKRDSIAALEAKLPQNLRIIERPFRDWLLGLKSKQVTRARIVKTRGRYAPRILIDSLGRVSTRVMFDSLNSNGVNSMIDLGARISSFIYAKNKVEPAAIDRLRSLGVDLFIEDMRGGMIYCAIPVDVVEDFANIAGLTSIETTRGAITHVGNVGSKGDTVLQATDARNIFYLDGSGVKVGVISDGANSWASDTASNELPGSFQVLHDDGPHGPTDSLDEGTALAEIVHDIAPGATLAFSSAGNDMNTTNQRILELKNIGCNIVVDDILRIDDEPGYQSDISFSTAHYVDSVAKSGVVYLSSAGNWGQTTYDSVFERQSYGSNHHLWGYGDPDNIITVKNNGTIHALLQWNERWFQAQEDYKMAAFWDNNGTWTTIDSVTDHLQPTYGTPQEWMDWTNNTGADRQVIINVDGPDYSLLLAPRELKLSVFFLNNSVPAPLEYRTEYHHIYGHAAAESCLSVAAVNSDSVSRVADYSSHGTSNIYTYNSSGLPISIIERPTPTFSGPDKVQTKVGQTGSFHINPFTGTSASAPHIAGVVALMLQVNPNLTRTQIRTNLQNTASQVSGWGGAGLINAYAAIYSSMRTVTDTTFSTNATLNAFTRFLGTTTILSNIVVTVPANKTIAIENTLMMGNIASKLNVQGTLLMKNINQNHGTVVSRPFGGRVYSDGVLVHNEMEPKALPRAPNSPLAMNSQVYVYGLYQLNASGVDSLSDNSSIIVDSSGLYNLMINSKLIVQNTCSLTVKGGGVVNIPSGAQVICRGLLTVGQGGAIRVGKGGILRIEAGGSMQLLTGGNGSVTVDSGGQVICYGTIASADTLYSKKNSTVLLQSGGQFQLNSGGVIILDTSAQFTAYGTLTLNSGGILNTKNSSKLLIQSGGITRINQGGLV